jgi:hypothetical protein
MSLKDLTMLATERRGNLPDQKGVYHINAFDDVTQWQIVATVPGISERFLLPVLEGMMRQFPFSHPGLPQ